ncbi:hypothetical protein PTTG_28875 [Puccinia triticina 1-1 BBBD Race 1]|uniref:Uncharacterized protein n=1 Tax=Puccinia triticina (isolate 1-1 / race 1 (BBBD)) TaxID=630390 RepID=A0A180G8J3_PUCT1|nr:hypothetical protein PTTG_28875 [Puccinia triticina 1-1 BBBD Race 1]
MSLLDPSARARPLLKRSRPRNNSPGCRAAAEPPVAAFLPPRRPPLLHPTRAPRSPDLAQRLAQSHKHALIHSPPFFSRPPALPAPPADHQLVLYRRPPWPPLASHNNNNNIEDDDDDHGYPRIVEIGDDDQPPGPAAEPMDID